MRPFLSQNLHSKIKDKRSGSQWASLEQFSQGFVFTTVYKEDNFLAKVRFGHIQDLLAKYPSLG